MAQVGQWVYRQASRVNVPGHVHFYTFSCDQRLPLLTNDTWRIWLVESINHARKELDVALWAYVFMPEHVHLLVHPRRENYRISDL
jgi:putative transposase